MKCLSIFLAFALSGICGDWPQNSGPNGNFSISPEGLKLVEDVSKVKKLWLSEYSEIGFGKYGAMGRKFLRDNPGKAGIAPFGGMSWPVVADGIVFQTHFRAYYIQGVPAGSLGTKSFETFADDVLVAMDAASGKTLWKAEHKKSGLCWYQTKRDGWGASAAVANGSVLHVGTAGKVWCYEAKSGKLKWQSNLGIGFLAFEQLRKKLEEEKKCHSGILQVHPVIVDGIAIIAFPGKHHTNFAGLSMSDGKLLWIQENIGFPTVTPNLWHHEEGSKVIVHNGKGLLSCLIPESGKLCWQKKFPGQDRASGVMGGDYFLTNVDGNNNEPKERGRYGAFRLSGEGAELVWKLPEKIEYGKEFTKDHGGARRSIYRNGKFIIFCGGPHKRSVESRTSLLTALVVEASSGRILSENKYGSLVSVTKDSPALSAVTMVENLVIAHRDPMHAPRPLGLVLFRYHKDSLEFLNKSDPWPEDKPAGGYDVDLMQAYSNGKLYYRTARGQIACYSLLNQK